jgi:hypothetical protein
MQASSSFVQCSSPIESAVRWYGLRSVATSRRLRPKVELLPAVRPRLEHALL